MRTKVPNKKNNPPIKKPHLKRIPNQEQHLGLVSIENETFVLLWTSVNQLIYIIYIYIYIYIFMRSD